MSFFDRLKIDIIGEPFDLEYRELEEAISNSFDVVSLCNYINYALLLKEINELDLTDEQKDELVETIYTNCSDVNYNTSLRDSFLLENEEAIEC
jgi:hypothetical protein